MAGEGGRYDGDHLDFRGGRFKGPFVAKGNIYQYAAAPTALDALPARAAGFTGRGGELARVLEALDPSAADGDAEAVPVLVAALSGLGGIGKTALAVEAGHEACGKGWFPGGVLFLDLHGYDDDPVSGTQALEALLRALGAEPEHIPVREGERGALYRSMLAERGRERGAVLVVADNASAPDQVRPLLPGDARHRLLVTSRSKLPQLGARLLSLTELSPKEAYELLDRALRIADPDDSRIADEAEAAARLASRCGHLPLALQIAAALLVLDRDKPVDELATELLEFRDRLAHLDDGERSVRAAFDLSYRRLPADQARLLRLLALAPGSETTTEALTALTGEGVPPTRILDSLARAHLVERGSGRGRWRLHDLVRAFGISVVRENAEWSEEGEAARGRLLALYLRLAFAAYERLRWLPGAPEPERFATRAQALAWLDSERAGLVAAALWAGEERFAGPAVVLAACLGEYLAWRRFFGDWLTVSRVAQEAARRTGDARAEARAWNDAGMALREIGREDEAIDAHSQARDLSRTAGDRRGEADAWGNLAGALVAVGRAEEAIDAYTRARDLHQALGQHRYATKGWEGLGGALLSVGRLEEASDAFTRALAGYQAAGDRQGEGTAWNNLGAARKLMGRVEEAMDAYDESLKISRQSEDWYAAGRTHGNMARLLMSTGDPARARLHLLQAAEAFTRADDHDAAAAARAAAADLTP